MCIYAGVLTSVRCCCSPAVGCRYSECDADSNTVDCRATQRQVQARCCRQIGPARSDSRTTVWGAFKCYLQLANFGFAATTRRTSFAAPKIVVLVSKWHKWQPLLSMARIFAVTRWHARVMAHHSVRYVCRRSSLGATTCARSLPIRLAWIHAKVP